MSQIKNIIFDLGGVILNINYQLTIDAFKKLGFHNFDDFYTQKKQSSLFNNFETGKISVPDFYKYIKANCPKKINTNEIKAAWNAMLLDLPLNRLVFLEKINKRHQLYLLSNTNEVHITEFKNIINKNVGYDRFAAAFKECYYSSEIGLRKPNESCFRYVLEENKLLANETLFIDDSIQHIKGASSIGIKSYLLDSSKDIIRVVPDIIQ